MITIEEMKTAVGHKVIIKIKGVKKQEVFVENYIQKEPGDKEAMLLFTPKQAVYQSDIDQIEILG